MTTKKMAAGIATMCLLSMTLAASMACGQPAQRLCNTSSEELAVYAAYLRSQIPADVNKVILPRTRGYDIAASSWIGWAVEGRAVPLELQKDFARRNAVTCPIHPFSGVANLYFYTTDKNGGIRTEAQFEKRFGKDADLAEFSRVAFNPSKTIALLHVLGLRTGELYLLERKNGKWIVKYRYGTMAS